MECWNVGLRRHKSKTRECRFSGLPLFQPIIPVFHHSSIPARTEGALSSTGYTPEEYIAAEDLFPMVTAEEDIALVTNRFQEALRGDSGENLEFRALRKDGSRFWVSLFWQPIYDSNGCSLGFRTSAQDITERKKAEARIKELLAEKELLLKEVHHRIKNHMGTMMNMLELQSIKLKDPLAITALMDARNRMQSMGMLYDKLSLSESFREISIQDYLPPLIGEIVGVFHNKSKVTIETDIADFLISARKLSSLGIIVNELTTNAMKYAFTGKDNGVIKISASLKDNIAAVIFEDNGSGIPESVDFDRSTEFGLQLIKLLTKELKGTIRLERQQGTRFILEFNV